MDLGTCATRVVRRDQRGSSIAPFNKILHYVVDSSMAVAYALQDLTLARHIGCNISIVQSDCMYVVETMLDGGILVTSSAAIYDNLCIFWSGFDQVKIELIGMPIV